MPKIRIINSSNRIIAGGMNNPPPTRNRAMFSFPKNVYLAMDHRQIYRENGRIGQF